MTQAEFDARRALLPVAVMIDNGPGSTPHAGLAQADLVYEALVEGGITRLMAVYWQHEAETIEPVRSARTPFLIWADELGALYGHAGEADTFGPANAGGQLVEWKILDLNAFAPSPSSAYYRDPERGAPHNLVTSTQALRSAASALGFAGPPKLDSWKFVSDGEGSATATQAEGIEINYQGRREAWQLIQWHWDPATRSYARFQFGGPAVDAKTKEQLRFRNVIVMTVPSQVVDDAGHVLLDQLGKGPASVFRDGKRLDGTWSKTDRKARTRFTDTAGAEIAFNRGPIFIEVVSPQSGLLVKANAADLPAIPPYVAFPSLPDEPDQPFVPPPPPTTAAPVTSPAASPTQRPLPTATPTSRPPTATPTRPPPTATPPRPAATATEIQREPGVS
jgi:hypothetical protein